MTSEAPIKTLVLAELPDLTLDSPKYTEVQNQLAKAEGPSRLKRDGGNCQVANYWYQRNWHHEHSQVKDECQWQEERQVDPSLMQQPLDVVGKSEVLGGPQEACADHRVGLCCPGPDTPENASCS